jgi:RNA polymerase primary sigma factor
VVEGAEGDAAPDAVAELEAVIGPSDEDEPAEKREAEEPSNFLAMYFKDMARLAVLRPQEEFESARKIEALEIALWVRALNYLPVVEHVLKVCERTLETTAPEFRTLRRALITSRKKPTKFSIHARPWKAYLREVAIAYGRAQLSKNEFVKANLRLVVSIARRFNYGRMPLADLIQEGNIGLIKAVERFDYRRGYRFSTYASWWIRHAISRALADKGRAVRLPVHMIDAYHRVAKSKRELQGKLGRQPTSEEIGEATGIAAAKIEKMRTFLLDQSFSLDRTISDEDGRKFIDFIQDPNAEHHTTTDMLVDQAMTTEVRAQLDQLKPIEADILRQRFGLDSDKELTLKEIGEKYNLSRERIRQLQEQALTKMRRALQRKDLM